MRHCEKRSDVAIFDMLVADFSIEDCHAIARNDVVVNKSVGPNVEARGPGVWRE